MFVDKEKIWRAFGGILPGMFLLASAYATRQAIGYGDGLAVCIVRSVSWNGTDLCDVVLCIAVLFRGFSCYAGV